MGKKKAAGKRPSANSFRHRYRGRLLHANSEHICREEYMRGESQCQISPPWLKMGILWG